jgi:hypothetical protein
MDGVEFYNFAENFSPPWIEYYLTGQFSYIIGILFHPLVICGSVCRSYAKVVFFYDAGASLPSQPCAIQLAHSAHSKRAFKEERRQSSHILNLISM